MKTILLAFLFLSLQACSQTGNENFISQKEVHKTVKEISKIIRKNSIYTDSLNWQEINREVQKIAINITSKKDLKKIGTFYIEQLRAAGDNHSFFMTKDQVGKIQSAPQEGKQASGKYLGNGIGYIKVPGCLTLDDDKDREFAENIKLQIKKTDTENEIKGWIVDLRHNTGGNMWPMLAGLNALIEDGTVGYFIFPSLKKETPWISKNGILVSSGKKIDTFKIKNPHVKIAVLIDSLTASSGEMTAVSFSGMPNVTFFGHPTAGYTTANGTFILSNKDQLYLASCFVADRNHKKYLGRIQPDNVVNIIHNGTDEPLESAKEWVLKGL